MPIESGNAALLVDAYGAQQRANTERGAALSSGIQQVGGAIAGARKQMDENTAKEHARKYIEALGGNPEAADNLETLKAEVIRLHAATTAEQQAKAKQVSMAHDVALQTQQDTAASGRQTAQFAHSDQQQGIGPGGQYNPENDPAVGRSSAEADLTEGRRQEMAKALGGQVGELTAPVDDGSFTGMLGQLPPGQAPIPMTRDAGRQDIVDRNAASPGKYGIDAVNAARALMPQAPPPARPRDPALDDLSAAQAEEARARAASLKNPAPKAGKADDSEITQPDAEQMGVKWRQGMTWGQAKGIAAHRAPGSGEGRLSGQASARATYLREEIGRLQHQIENMYGDTPEDKAQKADLQKVLQERRDEYDRIAPPVTGDKKMPFADNAAPAPAAPAAEPLPQVDPAAKARFDASTPEQKQAFLAKATPAQRAQVGQ